MLASAALLGASATARAQPAPSPKRPDIVFIIADDLGYGDVSCQGATDLPTPGIDAIAKAGVRFSAGYMASPVSSPSRAAMLTGRYPTRFGHEFNVDGHPEKAPANFGLPLGERTFADQLKAAGYVTGLVGKWHEGMGPQYHPLHRGFSEFFGFLHGSHSYYKSTNPSPILRGYDAVNERQYLTEAFTREARSFVHRHRSEPFCLMLPYNAPHVPLTPPPPEKYMQRFGNVADSERRLMCATISALDDGVQGVMEQLRADGLEENTLVIFVSDNGGAHSHNRPFAGGKGSLLEGGIRVPFMLQWKGHIAPGQVIDEPVIGMDLYSTILSVAGAHPPTDRPIDGVDLLPLCMGHAVSPLHPFLAWRDGDQCAIRQGDWKLARTRGSAAVLVNLKENPREHPELASNDLPRAAELKKLYEQWDAQNVPPLWKAAESGAAKRAAIPSRRR